MIKSHGKKHKKEMEIEEVPIELLPIVFNDEHANSYQLILNKQADVWTEKTMNNDLQPTASTVDDEETYDTQHISSQDVSIKDNSLHNSDSLNPTINEEETHNPTETVITVDNPNNLLDGSMRQNHRIVEVIMEEPHSSSNDRSSDSKLELVPIVGYAQEPLLPLSEACAPLINILHNLSFYVQMALDGTPKEPADGLTIDESAAIRLYTIEWEKPYLSLYLLLNQALKNGNHENLRPYFKYMKLFLTAVVKLPCVPQLTVWRGVTKNLSAEFPTGTSTIWWAFSSCTTELPVLENNLYLGYTGNRTLFSVEAINGRTIRGHSYFATENEILLLPGTQMTVRSQLNPAPDLYVIHLQQVIPEETLLEPPFDGACLYPKRKRYWYQKKRCIVLTCLFSAFITVAAILTGILASKLGKNNAGMF